MSDLAIKHTINMKQLIIVFLNSPPDWGYGIIPKGAEKDTFSKHPIVGLFILAEATFQFQVESPISDR